MMEVPFGACGPGRLRALADALKQLVEYHLADGGMVGGAPCLRAIGSTEKHDLVAYVTSDRSSWQLVWSRGLWSVIG